MMLREEGNQILDGLKRRHDLGVIETSFAGQTGHSALAPPDKVWRHVHENALGNVPIIGRPIGKKDIPGILDGSGGGKQLFPCAGCAQTQFGKDILVVIDPVRGGDEGNAVGKIVIRGPCLTHWRSEVFL